MTALFPSRLQKQEVPGGSSAHRVTLYVDGASVWMVAQLGRQYVTANFGASEPREVFQCAIDQLQNDPPLSSQSGALAKARRSEIARLRWRLVVADGFHRRSARPAAKWNRRLAEALTAELEPDCPVSLDELTAATLPLSAHAAWTAAMVTERLRQWHSAAIELGLMLEGIWTAAAAMAEHLLENPTDCPVSWSDGRTLVEFQPPDHVRVRHANIPAQTNYQAAATPECGALPAEAQPALWAHALQRIDPSESFNLARGEFAAADQKRIRQRPLAISIWVFALALVIVAAGALVSARNAQRRRETANAEMSRIWQSAFGAAPDDVMRGDSLERQVDAWRNLRERGALGQMNRSQLFALASFSRALPPNLLLRIDHIRTSGGEMYLEGQLRSQAEARELTEALGHVADIASDSVRTSPTEGSLVGFSLRLSLRSAPQVALAGGTP